MIGMAGTSPAMTEEELPQVLPRLHRGRVRCFFLRRNAGRDIGVLGKHWASRGSALRLPHFHRLRWGSLPGPISGGGCGM